MLASIESKNKLTKYVADSWKEGKCSEKLRDGHNSDQLRDRLKLDGISDCVQKRILRMEEDNWVSKCR